MPKWMAEKSFSISMLDWWANAAVTSCRLFGQRLDPCAEIPGRERRLVVSPRGERAFRSVGKIQRRRQAWTSSHGRQAMDVSHGRQGLRPRLSLLSDGPGRGN